MWKRFRRLWGTKYRIVGRQKGSTHPWLVWNGEAVGRGEAEETAKLLKITVPSYEFEIAPEWLVPRKK